MKGEKGNEVGEILFFIGLFALTFFSASKSIPTYIILSSLFPSLVTSVCRYSAMKWLVNSSMQGKK